jgi:two-component system, OmpR family, osmolarity sensor histidine kinase EnvZ
MSLSPTTPPEVAGAMSGLRWPLGPRPQGIPLFWRTFLLLGALLLGSVVAWFWTFRMLEEEPRALQGAQQLASVVNLTRAALVHADAEARVSLVKILVEQENVRIAVREPSDTHRPYDHDALSRRISESLASRLGADTIVAREVNGFAGLWIGFVIDQDKYWLLADPERVGSVQGQTWLVWLLMAASLSMLGAASLTGLLNRPLQQLSAATTRVREGDFRSVRLDETVPTVEIRAVNRGFNRMAEQLAQAESDRTLMLAGISHDLRTPLARLRLETEMSVPDETVRELMAADIEQVTAILDKFLDYARAEHVQMQTVALPALLHTALQPYAGSPDCVVELQVPPGCQVQADPVELRRVLDNLLENASRYGRSPDGSLRLALHVGAEPHAVTLQLSDQGAGVPPALLPRLTEPFFRADEARTAATGAGLGLAIVARTVQRMGGELSLHPGPLGGLQAHVRLQAASQA